MNKSQSQTMLRNLDLIQSIFGESVPLNDVAAFVQHIVDIVSEDQAVLAQIANRHTTKHTVLTAGALPSAVRSAIVRAVTSYQGMAKLVESDPDAMNELVAVVYEGIKN